MSAIENYGPLNVANAPDGPIWRARRSLLDLLQLTNVRQTYRRFSRRRADLRFEAALRELGHGGVLADFLVAQQNSRNLA